MNHRRMLLLPGEMVIVKHERVDEIADEVVDAFSGLHSDIKMTFGQWQDLREMIRREMAMGPGGARTVCTGA